MFFMGFRLEVSITKQLQTINADELMNTPFSKTRFVVERLMPVGLHILAGAPKIGKSWLALWLCLCAAKGEDLWTFPLNRGSVLYLSLEDNLARIQNRLFQITEDAPETLHVATMSACIGNGLEDQIRDFLDRNPDTVLVVIDTLQRIRNSRDGANPYASDYQDIASLKNLADAQQIAILLIHHLRKMYDDDPLNMISGTTGLSGAADSIYVLKAKNRGSRAAMLYCTGRDIEYQELHLLFSRETCTWQLLEKGDQPEVDAAAEDPVLARLIPFLQTIVPFQDTATALSSLLEAELGITMPASVLSKKLTRHAEKLREAGIQFTTSRTREARMLHLLWIPGDGSDACDGKTEACSGADFVSQLSQASPAEDAQREPPGGALCRDFENTE